MSRYQLFGLFVVFVFFIIILRDFIPGKKEEFNANSIILSTQFTLKTHGNYNFDSAESMTGTLIQFGGVPEDMNIIGEKTSGTAKLKNKWGGNVTVAPEGEYQHSFSLTYEKVPYAFCVKFVPTLSATLQLESIKIGETTTHGKIKTSDVEAMCQKDDWFSGVNTLKFTTNS